MDICFQLVVNGTFFSSFGYYAMRYAQGQTFMLLLPTAHLLFVRRCPGTANTSFWLQDFSTSGKMLTDYEIS